MNESLSVTDLALIKNIIDLACSRGAFKASEMRSVGEVYDKLAVFLDTIIAQASAANAPDTQTTQGDAV